MTCVKRDVYCRMYDPLGPRGGNTCLYELRDRSLFKGSWRGEGGLQNGNGGGGQVKFYPYIKGAEKVGAMLKGGGGGRKCVEVVITLVLAILKEEGKQVSYPFEEGSGHRHFYTISTGVGGVAKSFRPAIFPFCSPASPYLMTGS